MIGRRSSAVLRYFLMKFYDSLATPRRCSYVTVRRRAKMQFAGNREWNENRCGEQVDCPPLPPGPPVIP